MILPNFLALAPTAVQKYMSSQLLVTQTGHQTISVLPNKHQIFNNFIWSLRHSFRPISFILNQSSPPCCISTHRAMVSNLYIRAISKPRCTFGIHGFTKPVVSLKENGFSGSFPEGYIILGIEMWLTVQTSAGQIVRDGWKYFLKHRTNRHGGGGLAYIRLELSVSIISHSLRYILPENLRTSVLILKCRVHLGFVYKRPSSNNSELINCS